MRESRAGANGLSWKRRKPRSPRRRAVGVDWPLPGRPPGAAGGRMNATVIDDVGPAPAVEPAVPRTADHRFEFHGDAREYFRIWIVNLALGIVTLGIYSAWARVRTQRYFYANTRLAGAPFDYQA